MHGDLDFWGVRRFLVATHSMVPPALNWDVRRWDGHRFYSADPAWNQSWAVSHRLWETERGELAGACHPEGMQASSRQAHLHVHFQVHPDYRDLEPEMLTWAEGLVAAAPARPAAGHGAAAPGGDTSGDANGANRSVTLSVYEYDAPRQALLEQRGYAKLGTGGAARMLRLGRQPLAQPIVPDGYVVRTVDPDDDDDCQRIADVLNAGFGRTFHTGVEFRTFTRLAPCYRADLDLVAVAPDGSFAAYVGVPYDDANGLGMFEPVCTHPEHRRRGLALGLMQEGLLRLRSIGARAAKVETGDMAPANQLYDAVGFTERYRVNDWRKTFAD
jgi:GNAT superfamily N-acetyltransferase